MPRLRPNFLPSSPTSGLPGRAPLTQKKAIWNPKEQRTVNLQSVYPAPPTPPDLASGSFSSSLLLQGYAVNSLPYPPFLIIQITCLPKRVPPTQTLPRLEDSNLNSASNFLDHIRSVKVLLGLRNCGCRLGPESGTRFGNQTCHSQ